MFGKIRQVASASIISVGSLLIAITWFAGVCLHLYTILFAYKVSGFIAAAIALLLPVLAQIYWVLAAWYKTDEFINGYSFYVFVYLGYLVFSISVVAFGAYLAKDE